MKPDAPVRQLEAVTHEDIRWQLNRIKSIALLPGVLAAQAAAEAGCGLAILVRDGIVTEGSASSVMIAKNGQLFTHPLDGRVLDSITRRIAFDLGGRCRTNRHRNGRRPSMTCLLPTK